MLFSDHFVLVVQKSGVIMSHPEGDACMGHNLLQRVLTSEKERKTLNGIAETVDNNMMRATLENSEVTSSQSLSESVRHSLRQYFSKLDGQTPANLYDLVLAEIERPLLEMVLQLTNSNQSKSAVVLGLSRGTLRKKMAAYGLL